jgi:signal transduction histidine kinase
LGVIRRSTGKVKTLITEILNYPKVEEMPAELYPMHQLLDELLEDAEDRITLKGITVKKQYTEEDVDLLVNPRKIKIAVNNIIVNAIEAMDTDKGELKLVTKSRKDTFIVEIEDNGCGISKAHLRHVFKPFYTSKPDGLGLGLTTTSDILQLNHVKVSVTSEEGKGTRFMLFFDKKKTHAGRHEERNDAQHSL